MNVPFFIEKYVNLWYNSSRKGGERMDKTYIAIDLKSFYASVECMERGLDPMNTNLVVADESRTAKTICLAVSPMLKSFGLPGRARLFEVIRQIEQVNNSRKAKARIKEFEGESYLFSDLQKNPKLAVSYVVAPPQMARYMEISNQIYSIYLRYIAPEDIHIYSIDEVFIDATGYLETYKLTPRELTMKLIREVLKETGITATAGIGTNLFLCKIAMDIVAKKMPADRDGVRIAELTVETFRRELWNHRPLTDFWRVGKGYAKKLKANGMYTLGDVAMTSTTEYGQKLLYKLFGINAELLIDHAWGFEPCTIAEIKKYKPENNSISQGQVLMSGYSYEKAKLIVKEMTDSLVLDLVSKNLVTNQIVLTVGYDVDGIPSGYSGEMTTDRYNRKVPKSAHGTINMEKYTSSTKLILSKAIALYERIVDEQLLVRRLTVVANHVLPESEVKEQEGKQMVQLDLFTDYSVQVEQNEREEQSQKKEKELQKALLEIKGKYGKNAILKGMDFEEGATARDRNGQVGGHKA